MTRDGHRSFRDAQIYYEVHGSGPAVLLVHGSGGHHDAWWQQVAALSPEYTVITVDLRGFGNSRCLGNFSVLAMLLNTFQVDLKAGDPEPFPDVHGFAKVNPGRAEDWPAANHIATKMRIRREILHYSDIRDKMRVRQYGAQKSAGCVQAAEAYSRV